MGGDAGQNFINTVFDDSAPTAINTGTAPFTGSYMPEYTLNSATLTSLKGMVADGTWQLKLTNTNTGVTATLDTWSLNITPQVTVAPVAATESDDQRVEVATEFTIGFPQQQLSGTYTIQLGPDIQDQFGDGQDVTSTRASTCSATRARMARRPRSQYIASDLPKTIPAATTSSSGQAVAGHVSSSIVVPDSFIIAGGPDLVRQMSGMQLQLNLSFANDPDLTATLYHYDATGRPARPGDAVQRRGDRHQYGQFHQYDLRRQRAHADPGRQRTVLRHLQPPGVAGHGLRPTPA